MAAGTLPILNHEKEILNKLSENDVIVVVGETGSGKTTQLPIFLHNAGYSNNGLIGVTQPRRIAAISVADFVAKNLGVELGSEVGYKIRFDDETAEDTTIKFMTDGVLLREAQTDPELSDYSVIIVDEAHERSLNIDFSLGLMKRVIKKYEGLKAIVTSATIEPEKFSKYFWDAPIVNVAGRAYPIEVRYSDKSYPYREGYSNRISDVLAEKIVEEVYMIATMPYHDDDILVFMTGKDDIDEITGRLAKALIGQSVQILPLYGAMMPNEQQRVLGRYPGKRKIIVATNIAETSITINGISWVIDPGYIKQEGYDPRTGIGSLEIVRHSQAGCDQRKGRAGRTKSGKCIRLYTEKDYLARPKFTEPEIKRTDLAAVVLQMRDMGIEDVENFDFMDPPDHEAFRDAHRTLFALSALGEKDELTEIGSTMASLPIAPPHSRMLIAAKERGCVKEVATIAAYLGQRPVFNRPDDKEWEADTAHQKFKDAKSDFQTFLNVWNAYTESGQNRSWCQSEFLSWRTLEETAKVREQILDILRRERFPITGGAKPEEITKAVATGLVQNFCTKAERSRGYMKGRENVMIHPSSGLCHGWQRFIIAGAFRTTSRCWAMNVAAIEPAWLPDIMPKRAKAEVIGIGDYDTVKLTAKVREKIFLDSIDLGFREREVNLREARAMHEELIQKAESHGWIKLRVQMDTLSPYYRAKNVATAPDETIYRVSPLFEETKSGEYYCELVGGYSAYQKMAMPRLRVVKLPEPPPPGPVKQESNPAEPGTITKDVGAEKLQALITKFKKLSQT